LSWSAPSGTNEEPLAARNNGGEPTFFCDGSITGIQFGKVIIVGH